MSKERKKILAIAGFDPSGGAGILADIKAIETNKCAGFAVCTANTIQNEKEFIGVNWVEEDMIFAQLNVLLKEHQFEYIKIGLIPSLDFLSKMLHQLKANNKQPKVIWDPILSASAGFDFKYDLSELKNVLKGVYLLTPNWNEIKQLTENDDAKEGAKILSEFTNLYLKGGHNPEVKGKDYLFYEGKTYPFNPKVKVLYEKHGSGCVFSSTLTANLALGLPVIKACLRSKSYMYKFLNSSPSLLGSYRL